MHDLCVLLINKILWITSVFVHQWILSTRSVKKFAFSSALTNIDYKFCRVTGDNRGNKKKNLTVLNLCNFTFVSLICKYMCVCLCVCVQACVRFRFCEICNPYLVWYLYNTDLYNIWVSFYVNGVVRASFIVCKHKENIDSKELLNIF